MSISERKLLKEYKELVKKYKEYDKQIGHHVEIRELANAISKFIHEHINDLIPEVLYDRYERNLFKHTNKKKKKITFLCSTHDIKHEIIEVIFVIKLKQKIELEIENAVEEIIKFDSRSFNNTPNNSYYIDIITDPYTYSKYKAFFYFNSKDEKIIDGYLNGIFREELAPFLREKYNIHDIFKAVNTEKFATCSPSDFDIDNCTKPIARKNIEKFVDKLLDLIKGGIKLIEQNEITYVYETKIIQEMTKITLPIEQKKKETEKFQNFTNDDVSSEDKIVEQIKEKFRILLKGSVKTSNEYIGFFRKEDYIEWLLPKYKEIGYKKLEQIFYSVVNPRPPASVVKFAVPIVGTGEKYYYFISMEAIPIVYDYMVSKKKSTKSEEYININKHHFFMFLKKIFKELKMANYDDMKIAKSLDTDVKRVIEMKKYIENYNL